MRSYKLPHINIRQQETEQIQVALGFPAYSYFHPHIYALSLLSIILGGNMSSRLFTQVRERRGLVYYVKSGTGVYQDTGELIVQAGVSENNLFKALEIILAELKKVKTMRVNRKELDRAKEFIRGKLILAMEDSASVAEWCGKQKLFTDKILTPEEKLKKYFKVTQNEVQQVAKDIIKQNRMNFAMIGPVQNEKDLLRVLKV